MSTAINPDGNPDGVSPDARDVSLKYKDMDKVYEEETEELDTDESGVEEDPETPEVVAKETPTDDDGTESTPDEPVYDEQGYNPDGFNKDGFHRFMTSLPKAEQTNPFFKGLRNMGEVIQKFREADIGTAPETPEEYSLDPVNLGPLASKEVDKRFLDMAVDGKLTNDQANTVQAFINKEVRDAVKTAQLDNERKIAEVDETYHQLWGHDFEKNMGYVTAGTEYLGGAKFKAWLNKDGMGNDPDMVWALHRLGRLVVEDSVFGNIRPGLKDTKSQRRRNSVKTYKSMDGIMDEDDDDEE